MDKIVNIKKPIILSPTWTIVLAVVTLLGMWCALPEGDSNFYLTAAFMLLAVAGVVGSSILSTGLKGYGYPRNITLRVVAWRYFLTQWIVSVIFTFIPFIVDWSFQIEIKRYLITHLAVLALFSTAAILLVTGKKQMDEARNTVLHNLCDYIHIQRERVRALVAGKEQRSLAINELDELYVAMSAASPVYSESLAYIDSEIKQDIEGVLDECIGKLADGNDKDLDALTRICNRIKAKIAERETIIQNEMED